MLREIEPKPRGTMMEPPMSQSAQAIFNNAPLGARVSYAKGQQRPPERFKRKLREWEQQNGTGYLVQRRAGSRDGEPGLFTLRTDIYGSRDTIVLIVNRVFQVTSDKDFAVIGEPVPGEILCLTISFDGSEELAYLARTQAAADDWSARNRYSKTRLDRVAGRHSIAA